MSDLKANTNRQDAIGAVSASKTAKESRLYNFFLQNGVILGMVFVMLLFHIINPKFLVFNNLRNVLNQSSLLIIMSIGMMMAMSVKAVDLSIAQLADAAGLISAIIIIHRGPPWMAFVAPVVFGLIVGLLNALMISYLGIPAIIGSLGMMFIIRSMELTLTTSGAAQVLFTLPPKMTRAFFFLGIGKVGPVPFLTIFTAIIIVAAHFLRHRTVFGREMDAVEGNARVAYLSGINVRKVFGLAFVMGAILSAIAGVALAARTGSAVPRSVEGYLMECFVSVYLGVILSRRNKMNVIGTAVGALFVGLIGNWITLMGLGAPYKFAINGLIILIALSIGTMRKSNQSS